MSDLVSATDWLEINAALRDATDTFFKHSLTYLKRLGSLDRFSEDRQQSFGEYTLLSFIEWGQDKNTDRQDGDKPNERIKVSFDMRYLNEQGLVVTAPDGSWRTVIDSASDYLKVSGNRYRVDKISYDGQLENKHVLCIVEALVDEFYNV